MAHGLGCLHHLKVVHGALSPQFISVLPDGDNLFRLTTSNVAGTVKILGYGCPYLAVEATNRLDVARYTAPEVYQ